MKKWRRRRLRVCRPVEAGTPAGTHRGSSAPVAMVAMTTMTTMTAMTAMTALLTACLVLGCTLAQESCRTPSNNPGTCILLTDCKYLYDLLQDRYRAPAQTKLLRNSQCGKQGNMPKVCCPAPRPTGCLTPDNRRGRCVTIFDCESLLQILNGAKPLPQSSLHYIQNRRCQSSERFSVCCTDGSSAPFAAPTRAPARPDVDALLPAPNKCGIDAGQDRIFGGNATEIDQYPWTGLVEYRTKRNTISLGCGASLISARYVLTAGHCVVGVVLTRLGKPVNVRLGEYDKINPGIDCVLVSGGEDCNEEPLVIPIEKIIAHPQYTPSVSLNNDIALLRLASSAPYTEFIRPICLPSSDITRAPPGAELTVAGWGTTETGATSRVKLHVRLPLVGLQQCQAAFTQAGVRTTLWEKQMCAGGQAGKDSCSGDSGGPLMDQAGTSWFLHGVVSFGPTPCAQPGVSGVYTKVHAYLAWIRGEIQP